jgi:hypothetical protein
MSPDSVGTTSTSKLWMLKNRPGVLAVLCNWESVDAAVSLLGARGDEHYEELLKAAMELLHATQETWLRVNLSESTIAVERKRGSTLAVLYESSKAGKSLRRTMRGILTKA